MSNNYNLLADYITNRYIDRISGKDLEETFVENDPGKRVMAGMLSENRIEEKFDGAYAENSNSRFESVPSMSVSFIVKKNIEGKLYIKPQGMLFYTVEPDYDKTVEYVLQNFSEKDHAHYETIEQVCDLHPEDRFPLPLTYKKLDIGSLIGEGVVFSYGNLQESCIHLEEEISQKLELISDSIRDDIRIVVDDRISCFDLRNKEEFYRKITIKEEKVYPRWTIDIFCNIVDLDDKLQFTMQMVNKTPINDIGNYGYLPKIFDAGMSIKGDNNTVFEEIQLDYFKNSYKERVKVYAISENTSVEFLENDNTIVTNNIPKHYQKRLKTKDSFNQYIEFIKLINDPVGNLLKIHSEMLKDYAKCEQEFKVVHFATYAMRQKFQEDLEEYKREIARFRKGIEQIEYKDYVRKAFLCMNKTFMQKLDGEHRQIVGWRLFQIVFVVSLICEVIRSEYKSDTTISEADMEYANLLYFPTGGGKTEAFLGISVFTMFFDRLRGKNDGISAFLKYPLRLLAVQQLDRVLTIVVKANIIKSQVTEISNTNDFEVGFFVGKSNTPNKITYSESLSDRGGASKSQDAIVGSSQEILNDYYRFIDTCPCCGKKTVNIRFNDVKWKLEHVCENPDCKLDVLPLLIVDSEIYRYLPSVVVSTIDKMAMLGTNKDFKLLFGQVKRKCKVHGFTMDNYCDCPKCENSRNAKIIKPLKDPIPTLFIQDEMHLVKESLGTFDAHYESFIKYYAKNLVAPEQRKVIRFIGATATVARYEDHIHHLYHMLPRRFPCEYPSVKSGINFYSYTDNDDITRIIFGFAPYGRSITDGMWEAVYFMRLVIVDMYQNLETHYKALQSYGFNATRDEYSQMLYDYWIELVYNNRKQDAMELENSFQNQANNFLEAKGFPKFVIRQMTSDVDFQDVRKTLFDIQANKQNLDSTNLILATSTISHGVDEDSFNIMYFFGMPNNNAEYIQAYSRTGRKFTGIVIDIIRLMRIRDRSYLKNFVVFHQNKDDLVESVPINRWAKNAVYSTLPGLLSGLLMQYCALSYDFKNIYYAVNVKKALNSGILDIDKIANILVDIYECNEQEKLSLPYKDIIKKEAINILHGLQTGNFSDKEMLSNAISKFSKGHKKPMTSLRDTEEQIEIQI